MMNFEKVKQDLIQRVGQEITKAGFLWNKKEERFERRVLDNTDCFFFYFVNYGKRIFVEALWGVSNDTFKAIYNEVTERDLAYFSGAFVLFNNMAQLKDYFINEKIDTKIDTEEHLIEKEEDILKVVAIILHDFWNYLVPYFEQHHTIDSFDRALNSSNLRDLIVHNSTYPDRAMMGLIAAKLSESPFYYELDVIYSHRLRDAAPDAKREYEKIKLILDSLPSKY